MDVAGAASRVGTRLRTVRREHGLTLREAAAATGFSVSHLSNVERGTRAVTEDVARAYANLADATHAVSTSAEDISPLARARVPAPKRAASRATLPDDDFGTRLLRLRLDRRLSLTELSSATHVSKSYLGNLERGRKRPSAAVAAVCDAELGAGGTLIALRGAAVRPPARGPVPAPHAPGYGGEHTLLLDPDVAAASGEAELLAVRHTAQHDQPRPLAQGLAGYAQAVADAAAVGGYLAKQLWLLAARCAEFTGWLAQEAGEIATSHAWTEAAADWARAGAEPDMAGYRWERLSLTALYRGRAADTVALASRASTEPGISPRIRGLAARRLAQGHALAGDRRACEHALAASVELLTRGPDPFPRGPSWGPNTIGDDGAVIHASCLVDLGAYRAAIRVLGPDPDTWSPSVATRTRARFVVRGALAFAGAGELDHACSLAESVLPDLARLESSTVRADVCRLANVLLRHPAHQPARALMPELIRATRLG
jgi:transcriptional regulator with XRE-family HTH domain